MTTFSPSGSGGASISITVEGATNPIVSNVALSMSDTEVGILLPNDCRQFLIKLRDPLARLKLSYVSGESGIKYLTIPPGCSYSDSDLDLLAISLYVQSSSPSQIIELVTWT